MFVRRPWEQNVASLHDSSCVNALVSGPWVGHTCLHLLRATPREFSKKHVVLWREVRLKKKEERSGTSSPFEKAHCQDSFLPNLRW